jgi:cell division protein FtsI (penicillin-binding protein 3)
VAYVERSGRPGEDGQLRRMIWVQIVLAGIALLIIGRLGWYQVLGRVVEDPQAPERIPAVRGDILDQYGYPLATSTYSCNVFFRPDLYDDIKRQRELRERLAVTATVVALNLTWEDGEMPYRYVPALADLLKAQPAVIGESGSSTTLAEALSFQLADRDLLVASFSDEMARNSTGIWKQQRQQALDSGGDMSGVFARTLSEVLGEPLTDMTQLLGASRQQRHLVSAGVPEPQCNGLRALETNILGTELGFQRIYPDGQLAAHVLGFLTLSGEPQYGLEFYYDGQLRGKDGAWQGINHPSGERLLAELGGYQPATDGADLILTIDRNVQYQAERIIREAAVQSGAESGNLIVLDPSTGAVIAMANTPPYDPAHFWEVPAETLRNSATSAVYEPGSVVKPLTIAAALDARVIHPDTTYTDNGVITVGEQEIHNSDMQAHGETTMTELLAYSLNVGAAQVATYLGPARFYEMFKRFGFSDPTGIDLTAEERGIMRVPGQEEWHMSDLGRNSYGQGMSATPIQVVSAFGVLANQGVLRRPHVVAAVQDDAGVRPVVDSWSRQVVSAEVADQVTAMLVDAVPLGFGSELVPGYAIAGKSGTSQVARDGAYIPDYYIGSYVGYGPIPNPRFVILVKLDGLGEGQWGGQEAGPAFARMFQWLMDYEGIPPNE